MTETPSVKVFFLEKFFFDGNIDLQRDWRDSICIKFSKKKNNLENQISHIYLCTSS